MERAGFLLLGESPGHEMVFGTVRAAVEETEVPVADHADRQAHGRVAAGDLSEPLIQVPGHGPPGRRFHRASSSGVTGTRACAAAGLSIARSETPSP